MINVLVYEYRDSMYFKDLFYCFFHYNLVTSDDIGLEFHQKFQLLTIVIQWYVHVKSKYTASNKTNSYQILE